MSEITVDANELRDIATDLGALADFVFRLNGNHETDLEHRIMWIRCRVRARIAGLPAGWDAFDVDEAFADAENNRQLEVERARAEQWFREFACNPKVMQLVTVA
jgi:hypothetical protein